MAITRRNCGVVPLFPPDDVTALKWIGRRNSPKKPRQIVRRVFDRIANIFAEALRHVIVAVCAGCHYL